MLQTGLALRFTAFLIDFTYGSLLPALLITMVAGVILGMGMPTTPAYIMQAALLVPAIMKLGVEPMAAHMFAFYFSCLSAVTPPVALAVYAAASIGGAGLWGSGVQAMKFAAAGFIVPFFFVYNPALLFQGPWPEILRAVLTGSIGVVALAASLEGYFLRTAIVVRAGAFPCGRDAADRSQCHHRRHRLRPARRRPRCCRSCGRRDPPWCEEAST